MADEVVATMQPPGVTEEQPVALAEPEPGRKRIRLRLDDLAWFSTEAAGTIPLLRAAIAAHTQT